MRSIIAGVAAVVSVIAIAATVSLGWVAHHLASEDGYVEFTSSLVADSGIRADVVQIVTDDVVERAGVSEKFAPLVRKALESAAASVVDSPEFREAFADVQRQSHRALFDGADSPAGLNDPDRVVVDLAPVAQTIVDSVTEEIPVAIEAPDQLLVAVGGSEARKAVDTIDRTPEQTAFAAGLAGIAAGVSLLFARRRISMVAWLGAGTAVAAAVVHLLADSTATEALNRSTPSSDLAGRVQQQLAEAALASLDQWLVIAAIAGGAAVLIGLVGRVVSR